MVFKIPPAPLYKGGSPERPPFVKEMGYRKTPFYKGGFRGIFSRLFIIKLSAKTLYPLGAF